MSARRTRRSGGASRPGASKCEWCKHMGAAVDACTWKARGQQSKFVVGADVSGACFGHMVASVWDGSVVRRANEFRLERCLALSVAERGNGAGAPPQHAWAASLLDACKLQEIRSACVHAHSSTAWCNVSETLSIASILTRALTSQTKQFGWNTRPPCGISALHWKIIARHVSGTRT